MPTENTEYDNGTLVGHFKCVSEELGKSHCSSSDAMAVYRHECSDGGYYYDAYCWSCHTRLSPEELMQTSLGESFQASSDNLEYLKSSAKTCTKREPIQKSELAPLYANTTDHVNNYRGIRDEIYNFFGYRFQLNSEGKPTAVYFPETFYDSVEDKIKMNGYKKRILPKKFGTPLGRIGKTSMLSAQHKFDTYKNHRDVLIVGGEFDVAAAYQMLKDNMTRKKQGDFSPPAVVSCTTGEGSTYLQCISEFDFLNQFENIIVGLDNDSQGQEATLKAVQYLPRDKVKIAYWTGKDPNKMLEDGQERQFISDYYNARPLETNGVLGSSEVFNGIDTELSYQGLTLPSYMHVLQNMMPAGEMPMGIIVNIIADTSVGKSSTVNSMVYNWLFNAPVKTGVVSLEATAARYALDMISIHLGENFMKTMTREEVKEYLHQPETMARYNDLWLNEDGTDRWAIIDERDGDIKQMERQMEMLIKKFGCRILVVDVLSDILRGSSSDYQEDHMKFQKSLVKSGVTIVNVLHTNKSGLPTGGMPTMRTEYDALGSSTFVQSAAINIVLNRNKMADNPIERNTTYVSMPKCRDGLTGFAGAWYYDIKTRRSYDRNDYFESHPNELPVGYDLSISSFDRAYYNRDGSPKFHWVDMSNEPNVSRETSDGEIEINELFETFI